MAWRESHTRSGGCELSQVLSNDSRGGILAIVSREGDSDQWQAVVYSMRGDRAASEFFNTDKEACRAAMRIGQKLSAEDL